MKEKFNICVIIPELGSGGVEAVLFNYFSHMEREKYALDLVTYSVTSEARKNYFEKLGFNIIVIPTKKSGFFNSMKAMDSVLKKRNYDVVHAHLTGWNCIPMFLAWKNGIKKRISHSHIADFSSRLSKKAMLSIQRCLIKTFANVWCACGEDAGRYLYGDVTFQKVRVLNNAIDVEKFRPDKAVREEVRKELDISNDTFCIGHIGRFHQHKNHEFLIEVFIAVNLKCPDSCLLLVGNGDLEPMIKEKVNSLGLSEKVKFLGVREDPERIYQAIDVFCLPSLFEGLPVVGVEAQAARVPCVVSNKVSEKIRITPLVTIVRLEETADIWANIMLNQREAQTDYKFPDEYNINVMVPEWENMYFEGSHT